MGLVTRKPDLASFKGADQPKHLHRQVNTCVIRSLGSILANNFKFLSGFTVYISLTGNMQNFNILASLCSSARLGCIQTSQILT